MRRKGRFLAAGIGAASLIAAALMPTVTPAQEEDDAPEAQRFGKWSLVCPTVGENRVCQLRQFFIRGEGEQRQVIMRVTLVRKVGTGQEVLAIALPLGADIQKGATFKVSDRLELPGLTYSFCARDGCYVEVPLTSNILGEMRSGDAGEVRFYAFNNEQEIAYPVSFEGFSGGYSAFLVEQ